MRHVADLGPVNLAAMQRAAAQGQFLNEHIDCIVPWRFPPQFHVQRHFARLLRSWGEANARRQHQNEPRSPAVATSDSAEPVVPTGNEGSAGERGPAAVTDEA